MFGKKQSGTKSSPPPQKQAVEKNDAPSVEEDEVVAEENEASVTDNPPKIEESNSDPAAMLDGLEEALEARDEHVVAPEEKKDKKPLKDMDDDVLKAAAVEEPEEEIKTAGDSVADLRIQRSQKRIWLDLRDGIDLKALARMEAQAARDEVFSAVEEIARFRNLDLTPSELEAIGKECANDMLGFGPLEELLERDDIADIMINGPDVTYIEVGGKIERTNVHFRDNQHLVTICQRIVGAIGRRVDEASPICDARLADGSRVNVIIPPLAVDGACMTIRKFKKDKLTLENLMEFGSMSPSCAKLIMAIGRCRVNVLVSGGTGSGKNHDAQLFDALY